MKKLLLSAALALSLPLGLCAEDTKVAPTAKEITAELRNDCEKIVVASQASLTIEEAMKGLQEKEQTLLTRFMTRGFTKDKFETLGKKISALFMDKKERDEIIKELMSNPAYKNIKAEVEQLVSLVEELYDVMVKAAACQNVVKEILGQMQAKVDTLMAQGYTEEQVTKLIQDMITEITTQAMETTQKNNANNA